MKGNIASAGEAQIFVFVVGRLADFCRQEGMSALHLGLSENRVYSQ